MTSARERRVLIYYVLQSVSYEGKGGETRNDCDAWHPMDHDGIDDAVALSYSENVLQ